MNKNILSVNIGKYSLTVTKKSKSNTANQHEHLEIIPQQDYDNFFEMVNRWFLECVKIEEKLQLLEFLKNVVKRDIQMDLLSEVYYKNEANITNILRESFLPLKYVDDSGVEKKLKPVGKKQVDLSDIVTIVIPWKRASMRNAIIDIASKGFNYKKYNQNYNQNYYFTEMDLCYAVNGNHHIASGIIQKTGSIEADVYDITEIFNHVKTDGEYWINVHTNERLKDFNGYKKVFDFRIAILYELARMRHQIVTVNI